MDYCNLTEDEIIERSKLLKSIEQRKFLSYPDMRVSFDTNRQGVVGSSGNCGNFAIALKRHLCNKGKVFVTVTNEKSPEGDVSHPIHAFFRLGDCIYDFRGKQCKKTDQTEEEFKKWSAKYNFGEDLVEVEEEFIPVMLLNTNEKRIKLIEEILEREDNAD